MRRSAKRDHNESAIVQALKKAGCQVWRVSGAALPDLLVLTPGGSWQPLEVKNPHGKNRQTAAQARALAPWLVVRTPEEALRATNSNMVVSVGTSGVDTNSDVLSLRGIGTFTGYGSP